VDNRVRKDNDINNSNDDNRENNGDNTVPVVVEIGCPICRWKLPSSSFPSIVDMQKLPPPLQPAGGDGGDGAAATNSVLVDDNNRALSSFEYACQSGNFSALVAHLDNGADVNSKFEVNKRMRTPPPPPSLFSLHVDILDYIPHIYIYIPYSFFKPMYKLLIQCMLSIYSHTFMSYI
jgi:hypothetical protein